MSTCLLPSHCVFGALMRHQLSPEHFQPQDFCTLCSLVWNVPCCPLDEVLLPSYLALSSAGLPCTPAQAAVTAPPELPEHPQAGAQGHLLTMV